MQASPPDSPRTFDDDTQWGVADGEAQAADAITVRRHCAGLLFDEGAVEQRYRARVQGTTLGTVVATHVAAVHVIAAFGNFGANHIDAYGYPTARGGWRSFLYVAAGVIATLAAIVTAVLLALCRWARRGSHLERSALQARPALLELCACVALPVCHGIVAATREPDHSDARAVAVVSSLTGLVIVGVAPRAHMCIVAAALPAVGETLRLLWAPRGTFSAWQDTVLSWTAAAAIATLGVGFDAERRAEFERGVVAQAAGDRARAFAGHLLRLLSATAPEARLHCPPLPTDDASVATVGASAFGIVAADDPGCSPYAEADEQLQYSELVVVVAVRLLEEDRDGPLAGSPIRLGAPDSPTDAEAIKKQCLAEAAEVVLDTIAATAYRFAAGASVACYAFGLDLAGVPAENPAFAAGADDPFMADPTRRAAAFARLLQQQYHEALAAAGCDPDEFGGLRIGIDTGDATCDVPRAGAAHDCGQLAVCSAAAEVALAISERAPERVILVSGDVAHELRDHLTSDYGSYALLDRPVRLFALGAPWSRAGVAALAHLESRRAEQSEAAIAAKRQHAGSRTSMSFSFGLSAVSLDRSCDSRVFGQSRASLGASRVMSESTRTGGGGHRAAVIGSPEASASGGSSPRHRGLDSAELSMRTGHTRAPRPRASAAARAKEVAALEEAVSAHVATRLEARVECGSGERYVAEDVEHDFQDLQLAGSAGRPVAAADVVCGLALAVAHIGRGYAAGEPGPGVWAIVVCATALHVAAAVAVGRRSPGFAALSAHSAAVVAACVLWVVAEMLSDDRRGQVCRFVVLRTFSLAACAAVPHALPGWIPALLATALHVAYAAAAQPQRVDLFPVVAIAFIEAPVLLVTLLSRRHAQRSGYAQEASARLRAEFWGATRMRLERAVTAVVARIAIPRAGICTRDGASGWDGLRVQGDALVLAIALRDVRLRPMWDVPAVGPPTSPDVAPPLPMSGRSTPHWTPEPPSLGGTASSMPAWNASTAGSDTQGVPCDPVAERRASTLLWSAVLRAIERELAVYEFASVHRVGGAWVVVAMLASPSSPRMYRQVKQSKAEACFRAVAHACHSAVRRSTGRISAAVVQGPVWGQFTGIERRQFEVGGPAVHEALHQIGSR